jgi:hypothetical protein
VTGPAQWPLRPGLASQRPKVLGGPKAAEGSPARDQNGLTNDGKWVTVTRFGLHL